MAKDKEKESFEDKSMKNFNDPVRLMDKEIREAITKYISQPHINYGLIIAVLDLHKSRLRQFTLNFDDALHFKKTKEKAEYIG